MHNRHDRAKSRGPLLVSHGGSATFDTNDLDQHHSVSPSSEDDTPRSKGGGSKLLLPARYANGALLGAACLVALACFVLITKHSQYERAQRHLESIYQAKLKAEYSAIESLNEEQRMLKDHLSEVATMADSAKQANEECQRTASSVTTSLAAKEEGARALALRADAAEAARAQAEADAAAARARLESEVADLRARAAAAEARAAEAHGRLESERQRREGLEAGARQSNLLRHLPRAEGASDRGAAQHGELAPLLKQLARNGDVLVAVCDREMTHPSDYLTTWVRQVQHLGLSNALVLSSDSTVVGKVKALGMDALLINPKVVPEAPPATRHAALKWAALGLVLDLGYSVLYSDLDVAFVRDPFPLLKRDSDLEAMSGAADRETAYGLDQPAPGEATALAPRRLVIAGLSPSLLYLRPTQAAADLAASMVRGLQAGADPEGSLLDRATLAPAHGNYVRSVRLRVLPVERFMMAAALFGARQGPSEVLGAGEAAVVHFGRGQGERLRGMRAVIDYAHGRTEGLEAMASPARGAKRQQQD